MNESSTQRMTRYVAVVVRWLLIGAAVFGLTVFAGLYVINNLIVKVYVATTTLELPASDLAVPTLGPGLDSEDVQPEFQNIMMSPDFLLGIVKQLGLDKEWARRLNLEQNQLPDVDALTRMEKIVRIGVEAGTSHITVSAQSDVPQESADIANAIAERYKAGREAGEDPALEKKEVHILIRASAPADPVKPNRSLDFIVTLVLATFAGLTAASFVEMIFLFIRAGERADN
jgi:capsular polysaccharide biosynthesis protein